MDQPHGRREHPQEPRMPPLGPKLFHLGVVGGCGVCAHHGGLQSMGSLASQPMVLPGKNTGVGSHSLLQGIFPTQGSDPGLLHCRRILSHLSHRGMLERESSQPRDPTQSPASQADSLLSELPGKHYLNFRKIENRTLSVTT